MAYAVHTGHDTALVSLINFAQQPRCQGLQYTRTTALGDRSVWNEGPFFVHVWDFVDSQGYATDVLAYQAILTQCGLASASLSFVTVTGPDARFNIVRYNATVALPTDLQRQNVFLRNLALVFTDLEAL
jgi:hypothetical protein